VVNFLSHSVISGFTSGAAITIGLSQMGHMLGYKVTKSHYIHKTLHGLFSKIGDVRFASSRLSFVWQGSLECRGRAQGGGGGLGGLVAEKLPGGVAAGVLGASFKGRFLSPLPNPNFVRFATSLRCVLGRALGGHQLPQRRSTLSFSLHSLTRDFGGLGVRDAVQVVHVPDGHDLAHGAHDVQVPGQELPQAQAAASARPAPGASCPLG
jgi:hypothetical protein